jgi:hypothetical protein
MTDPSQIYGIWYNCVHAYTQLGLTYSTDKLVALSGLASCLPQLFQEDTDRPTPQDYTAGLWRADLLTGLLRENVYSHPQQRQRVLFRAPSWSWAATEAETWHFPTQACEFCCEVLEATVTSVSVRSRTVRKDHPFAGQRRRFLHWLSTKMNSTGIPQTKNVGPSEPG